MAPIKVGIIGLGPSADGGLTTSAWGVKGHLRSIQGLPDLYEVVAVANSSVESAQKSIDANGLPPSTKAYGNPEDIAADPNVELVVVCVEVRKHYQLALPALRHKKSLFVEWPLGASVAEAEELTKLAGENGVKTMVGLQGQPDPLVQKVKEILASGKIGKVVSSTVTASSSRFPVGMGIKGLEFYLDFKSGGNEFTVIVGHFLQSFTYLLGEFTDVQAIMKCYYTDVTIMDPATRNIVNPAYKKTAPDHIFIQGTLESSALVSLAFRKPKATVDEIDFRWYITGTEGEVAITTNKGSWQMGFAPTRKIMLKVGNDESVEVDYLTTDVGDAAKVEYPATNTARQYADFAKEGAEVVTFEDALKTHRLLDKIAKAAGWEL